MGSDNASSGLAGYSWRFQSTLPVWGATLLELVKGLALGISIHAPRVGSDQLARLTIKKSYISIHAPRVGSDANLFAMYRLFYEISIHAPRVGSDSPSLSPCG